MPRNNVFNISCLLQEGHKRRSSRRRRISRTNSNLLIFHPSIEEGVGVQVAAMEDTAEVVKMVVAGVVAMLVAMAAEEEYLVLLILERSKAAFTSLRISSVLGQQVWRSNIARTGCASINAVFIHTGNVTRFIRCSTICRQPIKRGWATIREARKRFDSMPR